MSYNKPQSIVTKTHEATNGRSEIRRVDPDNNRRPREDEKNKRPNRSRSRDRHREVQSSRSSDIREKREHVSENNGYDSNSKKLKSDNSKILIHLTGLSFYF